MNPPCEHCERRGCGAYHDECPEYVAYRKSMDVDYKRRLAFSVARDYGLKKRNHPPKTRVFKSHRK